MTKWSASTCTKERRLPVSAQEDAIIMLRVLLLDGPVVARELDDDGNVRLRRPCVLLGKLEVGHLGDGRKIHRMIERGLLQVAWMGDWGKVEIGPRAVGWIAGRTPSVWEDDEQGRSRPAKLPSGLFPV